MGPGHGIDGCVVLPPAADCRGWAVRGGPVRRQALRRRYYDLFSRFYDRFVAWHSGEPTGPMRRALAERATQVSARRVLDLCCGTGAVTWALAETAPADAVVVGLDFSWGMLSRGKAGVERAGRSGIRWVQADAAALPFKNGVFDVVTCAYALYELKGQARSVMLCGHGARGPDPTPPPRPLLRAALGHRRGGSAGVPRGRGAGVWPRVPTRGQGGSPAGKEQDRDGGKGRHAPGGGSSDMRPMKFSRGPLSSWRLRRSRRVDAVG